MIADHWERNCAQCGDCCRHRVLLADALVYTGIACEYLVGNRCSVYGRRSEVKPECVKANPKTVDVELGWPVGCGLLTSLHT